MKITSKYAILAGIMFSITQAQAVSNPCVSADFEPQIPPPPKDYLLDVQRLQVMSGLRTKAAVAAIKEEADDPTFKFWTLAGIKPKDHPALDAAVKSAQSAAGVIVLDLKAKFNRTRANVIDPSLTTVVSVPWHKAYPSGHSTQMFITALVFSEAMPAKAQAFQKLAASVAINREIAGLHYSTDTDAGYVLAQQVWQAILPNCKPVKIRESAQ
ncbi:MAG: phosphatase PAP2 family protein [Bacteroidetes bacterium]|nr:phosphatase PAP2 family protein [Bacteroidota bacterium]